MTRFSFRIFGKFLLWGLGLVLVGWLVLLFTQFLWGALAVAIFGLPALSNLQLIGLMVLGRLLTGGFGWRGKGWRRGGPGDWQRGREMHDRWHKMTDTERQEAKKNWRERGWQNWHRAENAGPADPGVF